MVLYRPQEQRSDHVPQQHARGDAENVRTYSAMNFELFFVRKILEATRSYIPSLFR